MSNKPDTKTNNTITIDGESINQLDLSVKARSLIGQVMASEQNEAQHRLKADAYKVAKAEYLAQLKYEIAKRKQENEQSR